MPLLFLIAKMKQSTFASADSQCCIAFTIASAVLQCYNVITNINLKATAADDIHKYFFIVFQRK